MSSINISDKVRPQGEFTLVVKNRKGEIVERYSDHNMIVNTAKIALSHLIAGDRQSDKAITKFACGTGTEGPNMTDTELTDPYTNAIKSYEYSDPENGTVKFSWGLDYEECNGVDISEFGLLCADGSLFAHKIRRPIYKASDLAFEGTWSIIF